MIQKKGIAIGCVQFTIDCAFVLSGDEEGQVNIWETSNGRLVRSVNVSLFFAFLFFWGGGEWGEGILFVSYLLQYFGHLIASNY